MTVYYRTDLTMRQPAPLFGVSPATVCRVFQRLSSPLALEPTRANADATDRLWIVDGTLVPVRDRRVGASSHIYRFSANVQVIADAETYLVVAAARPVPGNTADAKAWQSSGLADCCESATVVGNGAYINTGLIVPPRKRPGRPLLKGEEEDNAQHHQVRACVVMREAFDDAGSGGRPAQRGSPTPGHTRYPECPRCQRRARRGQGDVLPAPAGTAPEPSWSPTSLTPAPGAAEMVPR